VCYTFPHYFRYLSPFSPQNNMKLDKFAKFAWSVLGWNLIVIMWGAFVRASGSGAGCGSHWPTCNGEVIPRPEAIETLIELTHRATSGVALILVLILLIWGWRKYPKGHIVRVGVVGSAAFILIEALLGAGLVLFELTADNQSVARAIAMAFHLLNTFILIGWLALTAWWASGAPALRRAQLRGSLFWLFFASLVGVALIGMSGAITALGDTLFPSKSIAETLQQEYTAETHFLIRLRIYHPIIAILVGTGILYLARYIYLQFNQNATIKKLALGLSAIILIQWAAGGINVLLLAPIWMQLLHLLIADILWIFLVLLANNTLTQQSS
jgi:heme A synthase